MPGRAQVLLEAATPASVAVDSPAGQTPKAATMRGRLAPDSPDAARQPQQPHTDRPARRPPEAHRLELTPSAPPALRLPAVQSASNGACRVGSGGSGGSCSSDEMQMVPHPLYGHDAPGADEMVPHPPPGRARGGGNKGARREHNGRISYQCEEDDLRPTNQWVRRTIRQVDAPFEGDMDRRWRQKKAAEVDEQLARHKVKVVAEAARAKKVWETGVEPWIEQRRKQKAAGRWDTVLKRARKERNDMKKVREHRRRRREEVGRQLLKDMGYFMEQTQKQATWDSPAMIDQRLKWQAFIDEAGKTIRAQQLENSGLDVIRAKHKAMVEYIFNVFDVDGGG